METDAPATTPAAPLTDEQAEVASTFQASSPEGKRSGAAVPAGEEASSSGAGGVRQLPASAEYLPTDEQTADIAFLAMATQASRNDEIVAAIDGGQYVNVADIRGNTIMHLILERGAGQEDFVRLMHSKGAALDFKNEKGKTPLMIAIAFQRHNLIAYLIENGADVKALDGEGMSILHIACWFGHLEVLENLVKQKPCLEHLETRDNDQRTPLLVASFRASAAVCQLLQSVGANTTVEDKRNNKPADLAGRVGRRKSKELFDTWETTLAVAIASTKLKGKLLKKKKAAEESADDPLDVNNMSPSSRRRAGGGIVKNPSPQGKRPTKPPKGPDPSIFS
jgi:ankyrin repeat protein